MNHLIAKVCIGQPLALPKSALTETTKADQKSANQINTNFCSGLVWSETGLFLSVKLEVDQSINQ